MCNFQSIDNRGDGHLGAVAKEVKHQGVYEICVYAKDIHGAESNTSTLEITLPTQTTSIAVRLFQGLLQPSFFSDS